MANIEALKIALSTEQIEYLESIIPFNPGFPNSLIVSLQASRIPILVYRLSISFPKGDGTSPSPFIVNSAYEDIVRKPHAIKPVKK